MKTKLFIIACAICLFSFGLAMAQTWHVANQATVAWDAATMLENGNPIPENDSISYNIYTKLSDGSNIVHIGTTNMTTHTVTFSEEGRYFIGFQTIRVPEGETEEILSETVWSDDPTICLNNEDFGVKYFLSAATVTGVNKQ